MRSAFLPASLGLLLAACSMAPLAAHEQQTSRPTVQPPVLPQKTEEDLRKLPPSESWKPGDPVREVPDLKRSETETSSSLGPVTPQVLDAGLHRLPSLEPWAQGRPARIVLPEGSSAGRFAIHEADGAFAVHEISGALRAGPFAFESLWRDPGACRAGSDQPLSVRYDRGAGRWLLSRWAPLAPRSAFHLCVALSRTSDPTAGGWYLYDFLLPMYRAGTVLEVGPKTYSMVIDLGGAQVLFTFDRTRMLEGAPVELTRALPERRRPTQSM